MQKLTGQFFFTITYFGKDHIIKTLTRLTDPGGSDDMVREILIQGNTISKIRKKLLQQPRKQARGVPHRKTWGFQNQFA